MAVDREGKRERYQIYFNCREFGHMVQDYRS